MKPALRFLILFVFSIFLNPAVQNGLAEPLPLKRIVELALSHSTVSTGMAADEQRAFASYHEARNQYIPQVVAGAGLGASWGFPLSLEGAAPSIFNLNTQSALLNPSLRQFVKAARQEWQASSIRTKDQRNQVIQDAVLTYAELSKWEGLLNHLREQQGDAQKAEQIVEQRMREGVDSSLARSKAQLVTARVRLHLAQALGAIDVLRSQLAHMTGLPAASIETVAESMPALPELKQEEDLASEAAQSSPAVQAAEMRAAAQNLKARAEHLAMLPSVDFAAQYAVLSKYNNYFEFYKRFERNNATVGVAIRFPFLSPSQHARAAAADADAAKAKSDAQAAKNQASEQTLKLQRSVEQLAAFQQVSQLEYEVAQANANALQVRLDAGTASFHDVEDAREQANERFNALQDANFEMERARIALLRATGELESWIGIGK
jgi:outer membrane protein TolC